MRVRLPARSQDQFWSGWNRKPRRSPALARELHAAEQAALDRFIKESRRSMGYLYTHVLDLGGGGIRSGVLPLSA